MTKYKIGWSICGETEIEAATREEAEDMFGCLSKTELAADGELEVLDGLECEADRVARKEQWAKVLKPRREPADIPPEYGGPVSMKPE
jgi:hypothetical protein